MRKAKSQEALFRELYIRYAHGTTGLGRSQRMLRYWHKRLAWEAVVRGAYAAKRGFDIIVASVALIMLAPLFLWVSLFIKLTDGGPVLYWQTRVGKWGREFRFPKFRSMVVHADKIQTTLQSDDGDAGVRFKMKRDPRITWIGRIMRKLSIDELPQLWCVVKGEMSLVGPRPPLPKEVVLYTLQDRRRLDVTPGLTCTWQISGRSDIPFPEQVRLDVQYIDSQSFWNDMKILAMTVPAVLEGKGAY